ncbi:hypothetical protein [Novosphingobium terrae]|uniref:hypothetical protein n=1 Tax=Novosphingobium terrae TaxID=2726189 RepID=UPI00198130CF|nr:hypothetical protein [Novosphingobium terrae]
MTKQNDTQAEKASWAGAAALAGAALGSAALAAVLLYSSRGKGKPAAPIHPEDAPETD